LFACRESHFSAYLTLWFPLLIWWTPLCLIRQILTRRFRLYAYIEAGGIMMPGNPIKISGCADPHVMPGAATLDQHGEQIRQEFSS
ncbi:hypothetical protein ACMZVV_25325, partial [Escherichia coli]